MTTDKKITEAGIAIRRIAEVIPPECIAADEPMSRHTSFRIGGPAAALITVNNEEDLAAVLGICSSQPDLDYMLVGNGSNFLVADEGYPGIVIKLGGDFANAGIDAEDEDGEYTYVRAGAAKLLSSVSSYLTERGLAGFEFASGIPGSIGGAVFMNAGAYGGEMKDILRSVKVFEGGMIRTFSAEELKLGYRSSIFTENEGSGTALEADGYVWGSILPILSNAAALLLSHRLTGEEEMLLAGMDQWHYALGMNALDKCFVTGFGARPVRFPHHRPSAADDVEEPVPGFISGGPNQCFPYDSTRERLGDTPPAKYYLDETPSADTNEIAVYWNSIAILVAAYLNDI